MGGESVGIFRDFFIPGFIKYSSIRVARNKNGLFYLKGVHLFPVLFRLPRSKARTGSPKKASNDPFNFN